MAGFSLKMAEDKLTQDLVNWNDFSEFVWVTFFNESEYSKYFTVSAPKVGMFHPDLIWAVGVP